jgi:hypothetical protein
MIKREKIKREIETNWRRREMEKIKIRRESKSIEREKNNFHTKVSTNEA